MRPICLSLTVLLAALLISACGSSADDTETSVSASPTPGTSPTPSGPTPVPGPGVTDKQITLGMTNDMAGKGDTPYAAITLAMQAYFRKVNAEEDGVCGRDLVLQAEDDGYSPALALEQTKKLVEQTGVLAMVGGLGTEAQQGVAAYLNDPNGDGDTSDGVPDLFVSSAWSGWADAARYPWTIGYIADYQTDGIVLGRYISEKLPGKKVGIVYSDDAMGNDYLSGLTAGVADPALLISKHSFAPDATTLVEQVGRAKAEGAEVVLLAATPEKTVMAIEAAGTLDWKPTWLLSYTNAPSTLASRLGGGATPDQLLAGFAKLDGSITTEYLLSPVEDEHEEPIQEHTRIMQTYDGPAVSSLSAYGQSLGEIVAETMIRSCSNLTRAGLMAAAESMTEYRSQLMQPGVTVNLSDTDHRAIQALQPAVIHADSSVTSDGDLVDVEDVAASPIAPVSPDSPTLTATPAPA